MTVDRTVQMAHVNYVPLLIGLCVPVFLAAFHSYSVSTAITAISGEIGVRREIGIWLLTSYSIAHTIGFPLAGRLSYMLGLRHLFLLSVFVFALASLLAGLTNSWNMLLLARVIQGFSGACVSGASLAIMTEQFSPEKRITPVALWGLFTYVSPGIGPPIGGFLSNVHWHWIFLSTVPIAMMCFFLVLFSIERSVVLEHRKSKTFDWVGASILALGLGSLQIAMDRGQIDDWFRSKRIIFLCTVAAVMLTALFIWDLYHSRPYVNFKLISSDPFLYVSIMAGGGMALIFSSFAIEADWLQSALGYPPVSAGLVIGPLGIFPPILVLLFRYVIHKLDLRIWTVMGLLIFAISFFLLSKINLYSSFAYLCWVRVLQGIGIPIFTMASSAIIYAQLPEVKLPYVASMYSFSRGVIISLTQSLVQTLWIHRTAFYQTRMAERSDPSGILMQSLLQEVEHVTGPGHQAVAVANDLVVAQAQTLGLADIYYLFAWVCVGLTFLVFFYNTRKKTATHTVLNY
ncbi:MAG: DHA2 family efflux MFS transporter permease subunit [Verrucomicrobia bacterium]|nr:DHA2 family efflux MFS transporter permease subunit [Verrucomicrobiota bacterium]MBS0645726.1 DHA2 family efflux MFS transporter permease subunit [Verrucomicrobiota bacterium]